MSMSPIHMLHPQNKCPAVATPQSYYIDGRGRNAGLKLRFPDGYQATLTYDVIRDLRLDEPTDEEQEPA